MLNGARGAGSRATDPVVRGARRRRSRADRLVRRLVRSGAAAVALAVLTAPAAPADQGLQESSTNRFVLDTKDTVVEASISISLRNVTPDRTTGNGSYSYYYSSYSLPVPAGAENVRAVSGGSALPVTLRSTDDPSVDLARISFPDLTYGRSRTIDVSYVVPGEPIRSPDYTRVGPGYATFAATGFGDPGQVRVEVVVPASMTFDSTSDAFAPNQEGSTVTYTATTTNENGGFWSVVSLRDPNQVAEKKVSVGTVHLTLLSFPDDRKWPTFVAKHVREGLPVLTALVGTPWPGGLDTIREDASPLVLGYDGWFDPTDNEIVIGEDLDEDVLYHELAHSWLNPDHLSGRWLYEGLVQVVADKAVRKTGGTRATHRTPDRSSTVAVPLTTWKESSAARSQEVDAYAYPASYTAVADLVDGLDDSHLSAVISAAVRGESAYEPAGSVEHNSGRTDWKRFLDLLESRGGATGATGVYRTWVLTKKQQALLGTRAEARAAYAKVDQADGSWLPVEGLRAAMTRWDFAQAEKLVEVSTPLANAARSVQRAAEHTGLTAPASLRTDYESADADSEYAALATELPRAAQVITRVGAARTAAEQSRNPVSALGTLVLGVERSAAQARTDLAAGRIEAAADEADTATSRADLALPVGAGLVLLVVLFLTGLALVTRHRLARRRARLSAPTP